MLQLFSPKKEDVMSSEKCEVPSYMMSHKVSEQSPMRSSYLTCYKPRRSKSGHRVARSPSDIDTRHPEERSHAQKRPSSNVHKLVPRKSGSDLCLEDIKKQKKRSLLTTTLLNSTHEGWDLDHSCGAYGTSLTRSDKILEQKHTTSFKKDQEHESSLLDTLKHHKTNCSLTKAIGADLESHKNNTHFARLFGDRSSIHEFSALNAALPPRKLFFMQEYPSKLFGYEDKPDTAESAGCKKRRSYIEKSRNLFGLRHNIPTRDKCVFPDTCNGRFEITARPVDRPHVGVIEQDHEMYASYIGDHCRKNRRGRNSHKNSLPQSKIGMDSEFGMHGLRGDNLKRGLASFDAETMSDLSLDYPRSDLDERPFGKSDFSNFPIQTELNFNSYLSDKEKLKKVRNNQEKNAVIVNTHDRSSRCRSEDDTDVLESCTSISDKNSQPLKRRPKKKRQRSGTKKTPYCKQSMYEEEHKNSVSKHYNEQRRHVTKDVDNKAVSHFDNHANDKGQKHRSGSKIRRQLELPDEPGVFTKDNDHVQPLWTCTKWDKESRNKNTQDSSTSHWAYEVYSDTCLNPTCNGTQRGIRHQKGNGEITQEYEMTDADLHDADGENLDYSQRVLCTANIAHPAADEQLKFPGNDRGYGDVPNIRIMPFLVANHNPLLVGHTDSEPVKLVPTVWTHVTDFKKCTSIPDTTNDRINTNHSYQHDHIITAENKNNKNAEDKFNSQDKCSSTETCKLGKYAQKIHSKKSKHETGLDQTYPDCNKQRHSKFLEHQQRNCDAVGRTEVSVSNCPTIKSQCSVDEKLIRTVHSIKDDIESVFDRLNSLGVSTDDKVVKSALSLKYSVQNVLDQAKAVEKNNTGKNVVSAAEVIKKALKTLTAFRTAFAGSYTEDEDPHELSYEKYKMGKEEYNACRDAGSKEGNMCVVSIDSSRKPYRRVANGIGRKDITSSVANSLSDTDETSCPTLQPEPTCNKCTDNTLFISKSGKKGRRQYGKSMPKYTVAESDESVVESTILKKLAHSAEKTSFSSAESTCSRKSREKSFEQKFEEMLARFPPDEREFEIAGIPESLTRDRSCFSSGSKMKKKRKGSPNSKKHNTELSDKLHHQRSSVADEKSSWKATKRKYGKNSAQKISVGHDKIKATSEIISQCKTAVAMQPQVKNKDNISEEIEPLLSSLAPCETTDISEATEEVPALKKYREQMLQPSSDLDREDVASEASNLQDNIVLKESLKSWRGSKEYPITMHDIQIIYKIRSKTTLTEDEESFINAICLRKTEEEIMTVPYENESPYPPSRKKGSPGRSGVDKVQEAGDISGDQLSDSNTETKQEVQETRNAVKELITPSEAPQSPAAHSILAHDTQIPADVSKELLSNEISGLPSSERLDTDILVGKNADVSVFSEYNLTKANKAQKSNEFQEMPNSLCKISELAEDVATALDSSNEHSLKSVDKLLSACKDIHETKHNTTLDMQPSECYDASISSGYMKSRETTELILPDSRTSVREECIHIQQNEIREKQPSKATQNEAGDVLDTTAVSMLNASIMKLYEEVSKLRVKLETTAENSSSRSSPEADHRKNRSHAKKKKSSKASSLTSRKSSSSTQSSKESSPIYKVDSEDDARSTKSGHYFGVTPIYSDIQRLVRESMSKTELATSSKSEVAKLCCSYRKYDINCPETLYEYYEKLSKSGEQVSQNTADAFYLEYEPQNISPALYIDHTSQNPSPASYMEQDAEESSVASYEEQRAEPEEASEVKQGVQYFDKNLSRCVGGENYLEKGEPGCDNYWSELNTEFPGKPGVFEAKDRCPNEGHECIGIARGEKLDAADVPGGSFLGEQSNVGILQEYLSRDKQFSEDIVEYTSNTLTAENLGVQLNEITAKMNSVSAQLEFHIRNACCKNNTTSDLEDGLRQCKPQTLEQDNRVGSVTNCGGELPTAGCHTKENPQVVTEQPQHCSRDNQTACESTLAITDVINADPPSISETSVNKEQRSNLPSRAGENNVFFTVNSKLNSHRSGEPWSNSPTNCSNDNLPNVPEENVHPSSNEDISDQEEEPVKQSTPPMWSDSEESLGKNEEDYIASLHIPRIVQCVREMFFGSTKALSKESGHQSPKPYTCPSGTMTYSQEKSSSNSERTQSLSHCETAASEIEDNVSSSCRDTWRRQSLNEIVTDDSSEGISSPLQHNYIFRKKESRTSPLSSPSTESLKKMAFFDVDEPNEKSPHYRDYSWAGKDIGNYNFVGGNIMLTSQPFIHGRSMGYLPAFKQVEETDKTIRHYCDAINTNASKRLTSLDNRYINIPKTASRPGSGSVSMCSSHSENTDDPEVIRDYGRSSFIKASNVAEQNDWPSPQCAGYFPEWQSQITPSLQFARYEGNDTSSFSDSTMQQRRHCYVEHCGFRQKRCDNLAHDLSEHEQDLQHEIQNGNVGRGVYRGKCLGANGNNSSHGLTRKEENRGRNESVKQAEKMHTCSDMFYANEGMLGAVPLECSKKRDPIVDKHLFTIRDISETNLYNACSNIRSVDYETGSQMKHYKQDQRLEKTLLAKEDVEKSKPTYGEELEGNGQAVAEGDEGKVSLSDNESDDGDAVSDDTGDDERESWYKTTDDESNS